MRYLPIFFVSLLFACQTATEEKTTDQASSKKVEIPGTDHGNSSIYSIDDSNFEFTNFWNEFYSYGGIDYVVQFKQSGVVDRVNDQMESVYDIQVLAPDNDEVWNANLTAHEIELERDLLIAFYDGGIDFEDTYHYYNIKSGVEVINYTNSNMVVSIPNTSDKRFIGFTSRSSKRIKIDEKLSLGYFTFASNDEKKQVIDIVAKNNKVYELLTKFSPDMSFATESPSNKIVESGKSLILWNADEDYGRKDISGFSVILSFFTNENDQLDIEIPIKYDEVDLNNADFNNDYFQLKKG